MKQKLIIAALLLSLTSFAQDTLKAHASSEYNRLLIGINFSPDYCYRNLINDNGSEMSSYIIDGRNNREEYKIGYTTGLNVAYNISKNLGFELGVQYSNKGYSFTIDWSNLTFGDMIDPRYGFVYPTQNTPIPSNVKTLYNYIYLDIPLRALYRFGKKKIQFITGIGITTNILLKATQINVYEYDDGDTERKTKDAPYDFNSVNFSPMVSIGIDYQISHKFNLRAEPTIRYGLMSITNSSIKEYLWNGGFNISCFYALK